MAAAITVKGSISRELKGLGQGQILRADPKTLSPLEKSLATAAIRRVKAILEKREKELRDDIMADVRENGSVTGENGHIAYTLGDTECIAEHWQSKEPDEKKLKALLETKEIPLRRS
jgi:hypothetical protein